jgi:hypothetical protein
MTNRQALFQCQQQPRCCAIDSRRIRSVVLLLPWLLQGPALIIPLGDPLMTLTDTIFMGQVWGCCWAVVLGPGGLN